MNGGKASSPPFFHRDSTHSTALQTLPINQLTAIATGTIDKRLSYKELVGK